MPRDALNLLVFRESRRRVGGAELKSALIRQLQSLTAISCFDFQLGALLRAGELECAIADQDPLLAQPYMQVTDRLAEALAGPQAPLDAAALLRILHCAAVPEKVWISPPEGFAYYALDALAYASALKNIPKLKGTVLVVGIRSIGTTLSAVVAAAVRRLGFRVERTTVRPCGHPYNRKTEFSSSQIELIAKVAAGSFLVVDEGPGLSGSSFLSAAEALERAGVQRDKIILLCAHVPDFDNLSTEDAARRAPRFTWVAVAKTDLRPAGADLFIGGGAWRKFKLSDERSWPASWTSFERLKYLLSDEGQKKLFKFLGFGHYGEAVFNREEAIAQAGFGLALQREKNGFSSYSWMNGRPMSAEDLSENVLQRLAEYCAFRAGVFAVENLDASPIQQMADHNLRELGIDAHAALKVERPTICDGRMLPHEWLLMNDGHMLKTDSGSHGDDHFFPGPADIAWDLAGAIVEWRMQDAQADFFLEAYRRASGDDVRGRIADFLVAYAVFRRAYCLMAANALHGGEEARLRIATAAYGEALDRLGQLAAAQP